MEEFIKKLTSDELRLLMSIINRLGDGQHPAADMTTLPFFELAYVKRLIKEAEGKLSVLGETLLKSLKEKLEIKP